MNSDARTRIEREHALLIESVEVTTGAVAVYDADDRLIVCNAAYREIHSEGFATLAGRAEIFYEDLVRLTIGRGLPPEEVEAAVAERVAAHRAADGRPRDRYYPGKGWFQVMKTRTPGGAVAGFATDITRLKETEAELRAAREKLEEAFAARGRFIAALSHELRNPLNAILGIARSMETGEAEPASASTIHQAGREMAAILDDVLDHARLDQGRIAAVSERFDAAALIGELAGLYGSWAASQGLDFTCRAGAVGPGEVMAPRRLIYQAAGNLLSNAIKFTREGGITLSAALHRPGQGAARFDIRVEDTGPGMTPAQLATLFSEFAQLSASDEARVRGSGLGLSIARGYAEAMGGTLTVTSTPGEGSAFLLSLPVALAASEEAAATEAPPPERPQPRAAPIEVLAAEDNQVNQMVLRGMLARLPVNLTLVENGALAVDAARARRFDLILMDSQMPVMDGLTAVRLIRAHELESGLAPTRIVSVSANAMPEFVRACAAAGVDASISKPIDMDKLTATVLATRPEG